MDQEIAMLIHVTIAGSFFQGVASKEELLQIY